MARQTIPLSRRKLDFPFPILIIARMWRAEHPFTHASEPVATPVAAAP